MSDQITEFPIPVRRMNAAGDKLVRGLAMTSAEQVATTALIGAETPAGAAAQIAALAVPKVQSPILILGDGQSNMASSTYTTTTIQSTKVFAWNGSAWITNGASTVGAMVIRAAERLAAVTGRDVYCVISGLAGAAISGWVGSGASSARYVAAKSAVEGAIASTAMVAAGKTAVDGIVWMQGEADSNVTTYQANFETLVDQWDAETWFAKATIPIFIPQVSSNYDALRIRTAQIELASRTAWRTLISTKTAGIDGDNIHFNLAGHAHIGAGIASAFLASPRMGVDTGVELKQGSVNVGLAGKTSSATNTVMVGYNAGNANTGGESVGIGNGALQNNTQIRCTGVGLNAGQGNTGTLSTFVGSLAGQTNTANSVTALGHGAGFTNSGSICTFVGNFAGQNNTAASVVAVGQLAGQNNTGGSATLVGSNAGSGNTGSSNTFVGSASGQSATTGSQKTAVGAGAAQTDLSAGSSSFGYNAGKNVSSGGNYLISFGHNAALHYKAADAIFIGRSAGPQTDGAATSAAFARVIVIGKDAQATAADQIVLGGPTNTALITPATRITFGALPSYADDAAADADSAFPSGSLYRVAGGRAVFQKP